MELLENNKKRHLLKQDVCCQRLLIFQVYFLIPLSVADDFGTLRSVRSHFSQMTEAVSAASTGGQPGGNLVTFDINILSTQGCLFVSFCYL